MNNTRRKLIIFDIDNTLIDHRYSVIIGIAEVKRYLKVLPNSPDEELALKYDQIAWLMNKQLYMTKLSRVEARAERLKALFRQYELYLEYEDLLNASQIYQSAYDKSANLIEGVENILLSLFSNYKLGIVTNSSLEKQSNRLAVCQIDKYFHFVVAAADIGIFKPDPAIYSRALALGQCAPQDTVFIGDSWEQDVVAPLSLGMNAIWFNRHGQGTHTYKNMLKSFLPTENVLRMIKKLLK